MPELNKPVAPSSFYLTFDDVVADDGAIFKSVKIPDYKPKVQGGQKAIGSTKGGKSIWQVNSAGHEGLFTFECTCIASGDSDSTSVKMYQWFEECLPASNGGKSNWRNKVTTGSIIAYDTDDKDIAQWDFVAAWPSKYKCADLDVTSDAYIEETYTITCEKFNRVK